MSRIRLGDEHKAVLVDLYTRTLKTLGDLPCMEEFERPHASFLNRTGLNLSRDDAWRAIVGLLESGRLGRKPRPLSPSGANDGQ